MPPGCQDPANAALSPSGASSTRRARHPHVCISTACTALTDPICKQTPLRLDTLNLNVVLRGGGEAGYQHWSVCWGSRLR